MKQLSRLDMKGISGGVTAPLPAFSFGVWTKTGWRYNNGQCYCDYHVTFPSGGYGDWCDVPCNISDCPIGVANN